VDSTPWASDAEVIVASWHDPVRFEVVFSRHFGTVFRFLAGRAPRDEAADMAAEVFVRAFARRRRYRPDRPSALPWLLGMAVNVLREWTRRLARADRAHRRSSSDLEADVDTGDAEARMDADESAPALRRALAGLSLDEYNVLVLAALHQLTYPEIADTLGIPLGTVRSRLARARRRARELIGPDRRIYMDG
jgi:RNA polymerase sigma-70 factor (ECF subfamily)